MKRITGTYTISTTLGEFVRVFLRLVSAILAEQDEEWMTGKIYLNMKL